MSIAVKGFSEIVAHSVSELRASIERGTTHYSAIQMVRSLIQNPRQSEIAYQNDGIETCLTFKQGDQSLRALRSGTEAVVKADLSSTSPHGVLIFQGWKASVINAAMHLSFLRHTHQVAHQLHDLFCEANASKELLCDVALSKRDIHGSIREGWSIDPMNACTISCTISGVQVRATADQKGWDISFVRVGGNSDNPLCKTFVSTYDPLDLFLDARYQDAKVLHHITNGEGVDFSKYYDYDTPYRERYMEERRAQGRPTKERVALKELLSEIQRATVGVHGKPEGYSTLLHNPGRVVMFRKLHEDGDVIGLSDGPHLFQSARKIFFYVKGDEIEGYYEDAAQVGTFRLKDRVARRGLEVAMKYLESKCGESEPHITARTRLIA